MEIKNQGLIEDYFNNFKEFYKISYNSEKLLITLSSAILVISFSFIKLMPEASFKIFLLIGWANLLLVDIIIVWNQIHYRIMFFDKNSFLTEYSLKRIEGEIEKKDNKNNKDLNKTLHNFNVAIMNINYSIMNAQLCFITGIMFILSFSILNFNITENLIFPLLIISIFLAGWIWAVIKNFKKPLIYKKYKDN